MKKTLISFAFLSFVLITACKKDSKESVSETPQITSAEFENELLFVNKADYQIQTSEPAEFSSQDPDIQISSRGRISRLVSGEMAVVTVSWKNRSNQTTKIYVLGATDDTFDEPYLTFHDEKATDPLSAYKQGWNTLRKLPVSGETYAIILRHADANSGKDRDDSGVSEWWKSCDSTVARQLNAKGRERAAALGKIFKDLKFPVQRVISSEFCRATSTAQLMDLKLPIATDGRLNHPKYNVSGKSLFNGMIEVVQAQPIDGKMTLITAHHPMNELKSAKLGGFPNVSPFTWTGAFFVKIAADKTITYEGAVSFAMFEYWRNLKMKK